MLRPFIAVAHATPMPTGRGPRSRLDRSDAVRRAACDANLDLPFYKPRRCIRFGIYDILGFYTSNRVMFLKQISKEADI